MYKIGFNKEWKFTLDNNVELFTSYGFEKSLILHNGSLRSSTLIVERSTSESEYSLKVKTNVNLFSTLFMIRADASLKDDN